VKFFKVSVVVLLSFVALTLSACGQATKDELSSNRGDGSDVSSDQSNVNAQLGQLALTLAPIQMASQRATLSVDVVDAAGKLHSQKAAGPQGQTLGFSGLAYGLAKVTVTFYNQDGSTLEGSASVEIIKGSRAKVSLRLWPKDGGLDVIIDPQPICQVLPEPKPIPLPMPLPVQKGKPLPVPPVAISSASPPTDLPPQPLPLPQPRSSLLALSCPVNESVSFSESQNESICGGSRINVSFDMFGYAQVSVISCSGPFILNSDSAMVTKADWQSVGSQPSSIGRPFYNYTTVYGLSDGVKIAKLVSILNSLDRRPLPEIYPLIACLRDVQSNAFTITQTRGKALFVYADRGSSNCGFDADFDLEKARSVKAAAIDFVQKQGMIMAQSGSAVQASGGSVDPFETTGSKTLPVPSP
jgi:hypothetical protein